MINFSIKKLYTVFGWQWTQDCICGICQQSLNEMCSECTHPLNCKPCMGKCKHTYHVHCINQWIGTSEECPMCRVTWKMEKEFKE